MITLLPFILETIFFFLLLLVCFTNVGIFFLDKSKVKFSYWEKILTATVVGFAFFTLLSYLLSLVRIHFLLLPIIFSINILALKQVWAFLPKITIPKKVNLLIVLPIFALGILGQMLIIGLSGSYSNGDLLFWSSHGHDGMWHIALMEEYKKGYPLQNPIFAGEKLFNYHFFYDISLSDFNQLFKIPTLDLYFRLFPFLFSILLGGMSYLLTKRLTGNSQAGIWAMVFTYFVGSFGYIITFLKNQTIGGESIFWVSQIQSSVGNPPQIASFVLLLTFLYLFSIYLSQSRKILFFLCALLLGTLVEFKIYAAVVVMLSLLIGGLWQLIREGKLTILLLFILSAFLSAILYLPNSSNTTSFLIFEPWWFIRTMVVAPDRLNWLDLELRRQTYIAEGNWKRVIQVEATAFLIFLFGNLGMRFLGFYSLIILLRTFLKNYFNFILILTSFISFLLPLLFLQKGVAGNSIQFFQYFLLIFGIFAAISVVKIMEKIINNFIKILFIFLIIALSIPSQAGLIYSFYSHHPLAKVDKEELSAIRFLKEKTVEDSIILTPPYSRQLKPISLPPPIWIWSDSSYLSALSGRRTYIADMEQLDIMGYDFKGRLLLQKLIFEETNPAELEQALLNKSIDYIYFPKTLSPKADFSKTDFKKVFSNSKIEIWRVE